MSDWDGVEETDDELRPEYEFDYSKAKRNRFSVWRPPSKREVVGCSVSVVLAGTMLVAVRSCAAPWQPTLPALLHSPSVEEQRKLIAAFKAHPTPPLTFDKLPDLGTDANGLSVLFSAMEFSGFEGNGLYRLRLGESTHPADDITEVQIEVAGDPPRVVRRWIETRPRYTD